MASHFFYECFIFLMPDESFYKASPLSILELYGLYGGKNDITRVFGKCSSICYIILAMVQRWTLQIIWRSSCCANRFSSFDLRRAESGILLVFTVQCSACKMFCSIVRCNVFVSVLVYTAIISLPEFWINKNFAISMVRLRCMTYIIGYTLS